MSVPHKLLCTQFLNFQNQIISAGAPTTFVLFQAHTNSVTQKSPSIDFMRSATHKCRQRLGTIMQGGLQNLHEG